jgi:hypothetical protein
MKHIYIECAGMRVPYNWTPDQLKRALKLRSIKLDNDADIREVFGQYLDMIRDLNSQIVMKQIELKYQQAEKAVAVTLFKPAPAVPNITFYGPKSRKERR